MRYVYSKPADRGAVDAPTNTAFFRKAKSSTRGAEAFALLLVGGSDRRSLAIRQSQAVLRFDRRPSKWSHAALLTRWPKDLDEPAGFEVSFEPSDPLEQVPERNGVTSFALSKYRDEKRYPNLCLATWTPNLPTAVDREAAVKRMLEACAHPNADVVRYPLWDSLARWSGYTYSPETLRNPLLDGVPLPSAALCEYVFASANIDLTPSATRNDIAPEHLWTTAARFGGKDAPVRFALVSAIRDPGAVPLPALSAQIQMSKMRQ